MPTFVVNTNVPKQSVPASLLTDLSALLAQLVGKPEKYVSIHINPDQLMTFGGTTEPCAQCTLGCIGKLGLEENKAHCVALMQKLEESLGIPPDRMYINFNDLARQDVGFEKKTFA